MKNLNIEFVGHSVGAGIVEINGHRNCWSTKENLISLIENELFDSEKSFEDLILDYLSHNSNIDENILTIIENRNNIV